MPQSKSIAERTPPGQTLTAKFPVLHYGPVPSVSRETFRLELTGFFDRPGAWTLADLEALPAVRSTSDFHCVTTWSRLDNHWEGVRPRDLFSRAGARPEARFAMVHSSDGYYTNLPIEVLLDEDVLLAWSHDGAELEPEHGGPLRLVVPKRYAWKSAKWISGVELMEKDRRGYWEERGYHNRGEPFAEERYSYQETE
jgi:DMSO/TMAO reductase YedYZ molybdopterin-dependent catalytic subunit